MHLKALTGIRVCSARVMANCFELGITAQSFEKALEGEINTLHGGLQ
jgi:hypothetical protein